MVPRAATLGTSGIALLDVRMEEVGRVIIASDGNYFMISVSRQEWLEMADRR